MPTSPPTFTTQRSLIRNICLSQNAQLNFAETLLDTAITYHARAETNGFAQLAIEKESDYNYAGKGHSFATEARTIAKSSTCDLSTRLDDFLAGWMLAFCMGKDTFTAGVNPLPNTHVITWDDTGSPAKVTNIYIEDSVGLKRKWEDMCLTQLVLSGADKGSVMAKATFLGTGRYTDGAMVTLPDLPTAAQYLYGSDSVISIGPTGAPVSLSPRVLSWEATFDRQAELYRACGGGVYPYFIRNGNPITKLKLVIALDNTTDVRDWMVNETLLEIKILTTSGATILQLDYPNVILPKSDLGEQDKYVAYTVELDQMSILKPTGGEAVTATVTNTETAYLVTV